jgi:excisionase family DNA binding protein
LRYWQTLAFCGDPMHAQNREPMARQGFAHVAKECQGMPISMTHHTQLLTIRDAANALRVSYAQTRLWVLEGRLPSIALGQRTRRIPAQQLAKFIANNTTGGN